MTKNCDWVPIYSKTKICKSGNYILQENIKGRIYIKASNVQLNLNGRKIIPGNGCPHGIAIANVKNIKIFNGTIAYGSKDGLLVCKSQNIQISNLSVDKCCDIGCLFINVQNLCIDKLSVSRCNRALVLYKCKSVKLENGSVINNKNININLIGIEECDTISINNYQVCNNEKCVTALIEDKFSQNHALVSVYKSKNIEMSNSKINSNTRTNNNSKLECIGFHMSDNCVVVNCETNCNTAECGGLIGISASQCGHVYVTESRSNENKLTGTATNVKLNYLYGICISETEGSRIKSCDAHNNQSNYTTRGINIENHADYIGETKIINTTCNKNYGKESAIGISAFLISNIFISNCQCGENSSDVANFSVNNIIMNGMAAGIWIGRSYGTTINNSSCNGNTSINGLALGICLDFYALLDGSVAMGPSNVQINNCIASANKSTNNLGSGIVSQGTMEFKNTRNIRISNTQCSNNSHHGFSCLTTDNLVYDACKSDNNLLTGFNYDGMCDNISTKICAAKANGIGYDIKGINKGYFENNQALGNTTIGFNHPNSPLNITFVCNHADTNGTNYNIIGGIIDLFRLDLSTGLYTNVSGHANITKWSNIEI